LEVRGGGLVRGVAKLSDPSEEIGGVTEEDKFVSAGGVTKGADDLRGDGTASAAGAGVGPEGLFGGDTGPEGATGPEPGFP